MRFQSKSALAYITRNFWKLVYVALPIAVLMAFFVNPTREIEFWHLMLTKQLTMDNVFWEFNSAMTVLRFGQYWWAAAIAFVLLAFTLSMLIAKINRHMHVGEMPSLPFKRAFRLFPVTLLLTVCVFCASEILMLLSVGVMYILRSTNNVWVVSITGVAINFALRIICAWLFMLLILALPLKYSENYHLNIALSYSVRVMSKQNKMVWGLTLAYALGRYLLMFVAYWASPYRLDIVLYALAYLFSVLILPAVAYRVYHEAVGGERRDIYQIMFD